MRLLRNTCLVDTPFSLMLYLLMMSYDEIMSTKYITGGSLDKSITNQLPNRSFYFPNYKIGNDWKKLFRLRLMRLLKSPSLIWTKLYAQDHLYISPQIIGKKKYTLLADAPENFYNWSTGPNQPFIPDPGRSIKSKIKFCLAYGGTMYGKKYGTNNQCVLRWLVGEREALAPYMQGKKYLIIDPAKLWKEAPSEKKEFIQKIFSLSENVLSKARNAETIILTQPFREDCKLTDEEYIDIYIPQVKKYNNVIIKPHPRDKFEWEKKFPELAILRTPVPMQLLNYMGISPKTAVGVSTTAVSEMPSSVNKILLGTKVNEKIFKVCGDLYN